MSKTIVLSNAPNFDQYFKYTVKIRAAEGSAIKAQAQ